MAEITKDFYTREEVDARISQKISGEQEVILTCDEEIEFTGKAGCSAGYEIQDGTMTMERIYGQSGRISDNLFQRVNKGIEGVSIVGGDNFVILNNKSSELKSSEFSVHYTMKGYYTIYNGVQAQTPLRVQIHNTDATYETATINAGSLHHLTVDSSISYFVLFYSIEPSSTQSFRPLILMGTYELSDIPLIKSYNSNFVHARANLISYNKNLYDIRKQYAPYVNNCSIKYVGETIQITTTGLDDPYFNLCEFDYLPAGKYTVMAKIREKSYASTPQQVKFQWIAYNIVSDVYLQNEFVVNNKATFDFVGGSVQFRIDLEDGRTGVDEIYDIGIYYGEVSDFEGNETSECALDLELGEFDYYDPQTETVIRRTSAIKTINGSENWTYSATTGSLHRFSCNNIAQDSISYELNDVCIKSTWCNDASPIETFSQTKYSNYSIGAGQAYVFVVNNDFDNVDDFKAWLSQNPITFVYKLNTPTTEKITLPSSYRVWNGGLQIQETSNSLPYRIEKKYGLSVYSQLLNNSGSLINHQNQIDQLEDNLKAKQDTLTAGSGITISGNTISCSYENPLTATDVNIGS